MKTSKLSSLAPFLAVGCIVVAWGGMLLWQSLTKEESTRPPISTDIARPQRDTPPKQVPAVKQPSAPALAEGSKDGSVWSTYHGDPRLTGAANTTVTDDPIRLWRFQAASAVYETPVACAGKIFFTTTKGGVYAIDFSGEEVWSKHLVHELKRDGTPRMERIDAPAACFDATLLIGSVSGTIYAFDAATGDEKWTYDIGGPMLGTVNLHPSGRLFAINQADGTLHCIDLATGEGLWQAESIDQCDGSPAVGENAIVFGSCAAALHVISVEDGTLLRNIEIDGDSQIAGGVALVGDSIYSGSRSGKIIHANSKTGEIIWLNEDSDYEVFTTPAVANEWVVYGSYDGTIYGLDRGTGERRWAFETPGLPSSPVIAGDKVVVASDGMLYILRLDSGAELWSYEVSDQITSPAVFSGMVVVGSEDGTVSAFGAEQE